MAPEFLRTVLHVYCNLGCGSVDLELNLLHRTIRLDTAFASDEGAASAR